MSDGTCRECRYYVEKFDECRRFPPDNHYSFSKTFHDNRCGEFMFTNEFIIEQRKKHFK